jgi:ankyrin repeat protein
MHNSMTGRSSEDIETRDIQDQDPGEALCFEAEPLHDRDLPLHKAAYKGDDAQITALIARGVDINARSIFGCTPLQLAIRGDHGETVRILLSTGADASLPDEIEPCMTAPFDAMNGAAWLGTQHALAALIDSGINPPASALCFAASLNHAGCMRTILEKLEHNQFSDMPKPQGLSAALDRAALCWHIEAVDVALVHIKRILPDAAPEYRSYLNSALVSAARDFDCDDRCRQQSQSGSQLLVMQTLITAGADVNWEQSELKLTAFWAALDGPFVSTDIVRLLLDSGLQLDKTNHRGRTPLFGIIINFDDDASLVDAFLGAGAKAISEDDNFDTPLHLAAYRSFAEVLIKHGADVFAKNLAGMAPLHTACEDWRLDVVELLLSEGADINEASTETQRTPLLFATCPKRVGTWVPYPERHEQIVKLLIANGANVQVAASDGRTVLHDLTRTGDADLVRLVIEHDADVCAVAVDGETPLHSVCDLSNASTPKTSERLAIIRLLLDHGANINARDQTGSTPLHASWSDTPYSDLFSPALFNLLVEKGADRLARDDERRTSIDRIDTARWMWDKDNLVSEKLKLMNEGVHFPVRGGHGGNKSRGGRGSRGGGLRGGRGT